MKMKALIQKIKIKVCNINYLNLFRLSQKKIKYLKKKKILKTNKKLNFCFVTFLNFQKIIEKKKYIAKINFKNKFLK